MPKGAGPKLYFGWSDGILLVGGLRIRLKYELRIVDALSGLLSDAGSIPAASTILQNKIRPSGGDSPERRVSHNLLFSKGWDVPRIVPAPFPTGRIRLHLAASPPPFGPNSPFRLDFVQTSSRRVNLFHIN